MAGARGLLLAAVAPAPPRKTDAVNFMVRWIAWWREVQGQYSFWCGVASSGPERRMCSENALLELPACLQKLGCNFADATIVCRVLNSTYLPSLVVHHTPAPWARGGNTTKE